MAQSVELLDPMYQLMEKEGLSSRVIGTEIPRPSTTNSVQAFWSRLQNNSLCR